RQEKRIVAKATAKAAMKAIAVTPVATVASAVATMYHPLAALAEVTKRNQTQAKYHMTQAGRAFLGTLASPFLVFLTPIIKYHETTNLIINTNYSCSAVVNRNNPSEIFSTGYEIFTALDAHFLKQLLLKVKFEGEASAFQKGPANEFFFLFAATLQNEPFDLFDYDNNRSIFKIKPGIKSDERIKRFKTLGKILGFYAYKKIPIGMAFPNSFYKILLNKSLSKKDYSKDDPIAYNNMMKLKSCSNEELDDMFIFYPPPDDEKMQSLFQMYGYAKDEIDAVAAEFQRFVKPSMFKSPIKLKVSIIYHFYS
ncbi:hypothetical protein ROZALSC1DRAFT_29656, partial [Rozella allomycis CSF55]